MNRRVFFKLLGAVGLSARFSPELSAEPVASSSQPYSPGRIDNEYTLSTTAEVASLTRKPVLVELTSTTASTRFGENVRQVMIGESSEGWTLLSILQSAGGLTAVFEATTSHRGALLYMNATRGEIAYIPTYVGLLSNIRPRQLSTPHGVSLNRTDRFIPGRDEPAEYLLRSNEDPCYENVAALGDEYIGWTLVANEQGGGPSSLYLDAAGRSRQYKPGEHTNWQPDTKGPLFDPADFIPFDFPEGYEYVKGYSKRTLLGGFLPAADIGVWNPHHERGYQIQMILPQGEGAKPLARVRLIDARGEDETPDTNTFAVQNGDNGVSRERYWGCAREDFYSELLNIWQHWNTFYESSMHVDVPDEWFLNAARAGITLSRCSYRGLEPSYQVGEGAYTVIPERSHALFPVANYEFIWAHQLWNLTASADEYMNHYLGKYILPDGNFTYNTQEQVEAPLNVGFFLWNAARGYHYTKDAEAFKRKDPTLRKMITYVLKRYAYSKEHFSPNDRRHGLIWGSAEADLTAPDNDTPSANPYYYQNAAGIWRGLVEYSGVLEAVGKVTADNALLEAASSYSKTATEMRQLIEASLKATLHLRNPAMKAANITPFEPFDISRRPEDLKSYENHRFMQDWFLADWGDDALDLGHLEHRRLAGEQICGLNTDGAASRTSNFMEHGTLAVKIRQDDYRSFLLTAYALMCYAADSGSRYAPEDAYIPGGHPEEQSRYGWSAVVNSTLQPTMALRWLLCYEESDLAVCHLQKAAPKHWFVEGKSIAVSRCPTRFGSIRWRTESRNQSWTVNVAVADTFGAEVRVHIHPPTGGPLSHTTRGTLFDGGVILTAEDFRKYGNSVDFEVG